MALYRKNIGGAQRIVRLAIGLAGAAALVWLPGAVAHVGNLPDAMRPPPTDAAPQHAQLSRRCSRGSSAAASGSGASV